MNTYNMFLVETLTNMHVGSGDIHYDIVDNKIQRNPVTNIPVIYSSGVKGALRDYYKPIINNEEIINKLFGKESNSGGSEKSSPGHLIVFEANLILLPMRSSEKVFYYTTSPAALIDFFSFYKTFCVKNFPIEKIEKWLKDLPIKDSIPFVTFDGRSAEIEDYTSLQKGKIDPDIKKFFHDLFKVNLEDVAIFADTFFKMLCEDAIPIITRNKLTDEGMSENLFYEEVLPRKSKLYFILGDEEKMLGEVYSDFTKKIVGKDEVLQFGGNYSIGYGFSKIEKIG